MASQASSPILIAAIVIGAVFGPAVAQTRAKPSAEIPAGQPSETNRLLAQFRMAGKDAEKRANVVQDAIAAGPAAVSAVFAAINRELAPELKRYSGKFYQKALGVAKKQVGSVDLKEVAQLRDTVLGLRKSPEFTHETIVAKGDPALKRLEEIFVVDIDAVPEKSQELQEERQRLFGLGRFWEQCAVYLYNQIPTGASRPKQPPSFEKYLRGEEELAAGLAAPMDKTTRGILSSNARLASQLDPEEIRTILALNLTRNLLGLSALAIDLKLCAAARDHSKDMQEKGFFSHESPVEGKKSFTDRAKRMGTSASGENIYMGVQDGKTANQGWFDSPGHHANMLSNHKRVGVAGRRVLTEMFGD